jgi:hypothetical protein
MAAASIPADRNRHAWLTAPRKAQKRARIDRAPNYRLKASVNIRYRKIAFSPRELPYPAGTGHQVNYFPDGGSVRG